MTADWGTRVTCPSDVWSENLARPSQYLRF